MASPWREVRVAEGAVWVGTQNAIVVRPKATMSPLCSRRRPWRRSLLTKCRCATALRRTPPSRRRCAPARRGGGRPRVPAQRDVAGGAAADGHALARPVELQDHLVVLAVAEEQERLAAPLRLDPGPQFRGSRAVRIERRPAHVPSLLPLMATEDPPRWESADTYLIRSDILLTMLHHQLPVVRGRPGAGTVRGGDALAAQRAPRCRPARGRTSCRALARRSLAFGTRGWLLVGMVAGAVGFALIAGGPDFHGYGWLTDTFHGDARR